LNYNKKCAMGQFWRGCALGASVRWVVDHGIDVNFSRLICRHFFPPIKVYFILLLPFLLPLAPTWLPLTAPYLPLALSAPSCSRYTSSCSGGLTFWAYTLVQRVCSRRRFVSFKRLRSGRPPGILIKKRSRKGFHEYATPKVRS
jgi:hypothetical protein